MTNSPSFSSPESNDTLFSKRISIEQIEESQEFCPKYYNDLIPVVTTDFASGEVLMHSYMNQKALSLTLKTKEAHYFSRSRQAIWHKGKTSGLIQKVKEFRIDDDQDCVWLRVETIGGASCHVGYRSCFYRSVDLDRLTEKDKLTFKEDKKVFDPEEVYPGVENPTKI